MRKLLVFQHAASEPLGVLDPMLRRWGFRIRYANFARDRGLQLDLSRYDGLVVLGGPMNVDQAAAYPHLLTEIAAIREALRQGVPVLGICLGAQLLAAALGARVRPNRVLDHGGTIAVAVQSNSDASFTNHARTNPADPCSRRGSSYRLRITTAVLH